MKLYHVFRDGGYKADDGAPGSWFPAFCEQASFSGVECPEGGAAIWLEVGRRSFLAVIEPEDVQGIVDAMRQSAVFIGQHKETIFEE